MATHEIRSVELSSYLDYLPAIYREDPDADSTYFLGRFLLAFERILTGVGDPDDPGFEEIADGIPKPDGTGWLLAGLHRYFDPGYYFDPESQKLVLKPVTECAPAELFLDWLAGWVALSLRLDWAEDKRRRFIAQAVPNYRQRGTAQGLVEMLKTYTGEEMGVEVKELIDPFQIGVTSKVGVDTWIGGGPPFYFQVHLVINEPDQEVYQHTISVARAIADAEKPAHTYYELIAYMPTLTIGIHSTVGVDTLLGEPLPSE